ncbi:MULTISPECIES: cation diffusion facilitator family transporter [Pseudomonas]|uniref:cation diffusion facilitator family transporter n=1 Tax=Pseudomonas TaxID=286 RepID=UPI002899E347|nr:MULTISPECIES: cation diffusion facilitator family transporter [Pseudomonas]
MKSRTEHARLLRLATTASLAVAGLLITVKAIAWWFSGSVSLLAGLTDSVLDGAASLFNLLAVRYSLKPADEDHRYGHGKAESLAGITQALFIGASGILIGMQAIGRLKEPEPLGTPLLGIAVMIVSLIVTAGLLILQRHVIQITGSAVIRADSLHYRSDLLLNTSILIALIAASYGWDQLDAILGLGIALYILWSAIGIARDSLSVLMDQELPYEVSEHMLTLACSVPQVLGAHDLRTRISGSHWFVQLHLELPGEMTLSEAHRLCDEAEAAIMAEYPQAEVLVHADPLDAPDVPHRHPLPPS